MYELIKSSLSTYAFVAAFSGLWILWVVYGTLKNIENKKMKTVLRFGIGSVLICFWIWFFVCVNLYPISLAYYEYSRNSVEEKIGVINSIEQDGKDRINIIIDNTEYTMVYSSLNSDDIINRDIDEGDTVKIEFGVKSKYIFDICEFNKGNTGDGSLCCAPVPCAPASQNRCLHLSAEAAKRSFNRGIFI